MTDSERLALCLIENENLIKINLDNDDTIERLGLQRHDLHIALNDLLALYMVSCGIDTNGAVDASFSRGTVEKGWDALAKSDSSLPITEFFEDYVCRRRQYFKTLAVIETNKGEGK
jgi:hypothetical protein